AIDATYVVCSRMLDCCSIRQRLPRRGRMIVLMRTHDLFEGIEDDRLEAFAALATEVLLDAGQPLAMEGEPIERFWLIAEGRIEWTRCINGADVLLGEREGQD